MKENRENTIKAFDFSQKIKAKTFTDTINGFEKKDFSIPNTDNHAVIKNENVSEVKKENTINHLHLKDKKDALKNFYETKQEVKIKASSFINNINHFAEENNSEMINTTEQTEIVDINYDNLSYKEILNLEFKKAEHKYIKELNNFEPIIIKQSMAKIIINPDLKKISANGQSIIKSLSDNINNADKHIEKLLKDEQESILYMLDFYIKENNNNKILPQKIKDFNRLLFKVLQTNYFLRFSV